MGRGIFGSLLNASGFNGPSDGPDAGSDFWYTNDRGAMAGGTGNGVTASGKRINSENAQRVSTVYACRSILERFVASIPLLIYKRGIPDPATGLSAGDTLAPQNPLYDVLAHTPNKWQTAFDFRAMMQGHLVMRGNAYAQIIPGPRGAVDRLEPIHPDRVVKVDRLPDTTLRYRLSDGTVLLQDEMFHLRTAHAPNGILGLSPIQYAMETVGLALSAEEHASRTFRQGARPSGVISLDGKISDTSFKRLKAEINSQHGGVANSSRTMLLEGGAKFTATTMTADDLQFLQSREFSVEEIARWFDIPLIMLHSLSKASSFGSGIESIMLAFVRLNLSAWLEIWQQAISRDLIVAPQLYYARFDTEQLMRGDSQAQSNYYSRLVLNGVLTRNEARAALGYPPLPGLDDPLTPINTATSDNLPGNGGDGKTGNGADIDNGQGGSSSRSNSTSGGMEVPRPRDADLSSVLMLEHPESRQTGSEVVDQ